MSTLRNKRSNKRRNKKTRRLSPRSLRRLVIEEKKRLDEKAELTSKAREVDADEYASTLAKDIDFVKALKIKEGKLQAMLSQVRERKKKIQQRILKNI